MTTHRINFQYEKAFGYLNVVTPHLAFVSGIISNDRGKGHARGLMEKIVTYADENELVLMLTVQRFFYADNVAMDNRQLEEFYYKFGFRRVPGEKNPVRMSREIHAL